ncbi:MAG: ribosomal protein methylthiotransferase, partial [Pseudonocardiales bacterium]|nr:ribosomal protein methylthiotransferase [Pseudonocardiales bacterium]
AEDRVGDLVSVLVDELGDPGGDADEGEAVGLGRAAHQGPDSDGECVLTVPGWTMVGELVQARVLGSEGVAPYFDLSFQHASESVLRRMRRFGSVDAFLELCARIRSLAPEAGIRSNVIVGFPGETEADLADLERFLTEARLDAVGVFGYSDEDGTEALDYPDKVPAAEILERVSRISSLAEELTNQRAEDRIGTRVSVLVEELGDPDAADADGAEAGEPVGVGRAAHQAPDVDGECILTGGGWTVGELVDAVVLDAEGVDLVVARAGQQ